MPMELTAARQPPVKPAPEDVLPAPPPPLTAAAYEYWTAGVPHSHLPSCSKHCNFYAMQAAATSKLHKTKAAHLQHQHMQFHAAESARSARVSQAQMETSKARDPAAPIQSQRTAAILRTPPTSAARAAGSGNGAWNGEASSSMMDADSSTSPPRTNGTMGGAPIEDTLREIFGMCLPTTFDMLGQYQYRKATTVLDHCDAVQHEWRNWNIFKMMIRLAASCESTYHLMRYLETDVPQQCTLDELYKKLVVLVNYLADELQPIVQRMQQQLSQSSQFGALGNGSSSTQETLSLMEELAIVAAQDMEYYAQLLDQAAEFFSLRIPVIEIYRSLAMSPAPHPYAEMVNRIDQLLTNHEALEHPLLATLRQSALEELRTLKAALESEMWLAEYEFTASMAAMHRLKTSLRSWSDHIDGLSEYPLFDETENEDEYLLSGSVYSLSPSHGSYSTQQTLLGGPSTTDPDASGASRPPLASDLRRRSFTLANGSTLSSSLQDSQPIYITPGATEHTTALSRILTQKGAVLKRGFSVSNLRFVGAALLRRDSCITPPNALENVILGGTPAVRGPIATPNGTAHTGDTQASTNAGFFTPHHPGLASEMMASAIAKQEGEDGFALPVYQWSKRFFRSLIAKFTLYFHRWINPFEKRGGSISPEDLTRRIRTPVGISYLALMDAMLSKCGPRTDDHTAYIMLILETDKLRNKGAHYFPHGYLCPSTSTSMQSPPTSADSSNTSSMNSGSDFLDATSPSSDTPASNNAKGQDHRDGNGHACGLFRTLYVDTEEDVMGDFAPLWGLRSWPAIYCYPRLDPPMHHWPNIVSLIMDNRAFLERPSRGALAHTEKRMKTHYSIISVDPAIYLVLVIEGKRRASDKVIQDFMRTMAVNLQHNGVFGRISSKVS